MTARAVVALALWAVAAPAAMAESPETSIPPKPRPETAVAGTPALPALHRPKPRPGNTTVEIGLPAHAAAVPALHPRPRPFAAQRPAAVVQTAAVTRALPATAFAAPPVRPENLEWVTTVQAVYRVQPLPEATTGKKGRVCGMASLRGREIPPISAKIKGCGLRDGVEVTSVAGIPLSAPATVDCPTARAFAAWVEGGMLPAIGNLGGGVDRIEMASSYSCRPRNNVKGNKVSEHGRGAALDVAGIRLANGVVLSVLRGWGTAEQGPILKALHRAACGPFTTVLGPGADRHHKDHFHFDTARGRGPYCH